MDNSSSEISAEPGYSGVDVLFDAFNSTAADSSGNIGGKKSRISCVIQIQRMNYGKGISISQENDMLIGDSWLSACTDQQFLVRSQPVPVDKQVNQAGRTNWQALLGFPGGHETQNCNGVVQNLNLV